MNGRVPPDPTPDRPGRMSGSLTTPLPSIDPQSRTRYLILILLAVALTAIILPRPSRIPDHYRAGDVASRNIKAQRDLLVEDRILTEQKQNEAYAQTPSFYDYDPKVGEGIYERLRLSIEALQKNRSVPAAELESFLGFLPGRGEIDALAAVAASPASQEHLKSAIVIPYSAMIVENLDRFNQDREKGITVRDLQRETVINPGNRTIIGLNEVGKEIAGRISEIRDLSYARRKTLESIVIRMLRPDLTYNRGETEVRRKAAADTVKPALFQIKRGEMIVREGERINDEQVRKLQAIAALGGDYLGSLRTGLGMALLTVLIFFSAHRYGKINIRKYRLVNRDLIFLATAFTGLFLLLRLMQIVSAALDSAFPAIEPSTYAYLFPFAAGAMIVRIVLNSEIALLFNIIASLLVGIQFNSIPLLIYSLVGGLIGAHRVRHCKERSVIYRAGLDLGLVSAIAVLLLQLQTGLPLSLQTAWAIVFALCGGLVCAALVIAVVPLFESLFRYTTDIKLLELANMNNPVLRDLMVQAPGTYHHSVIVGNLVEAAAEAINANPLLAKVAAYYHDIGKIKKPLYFIENIRDNDNKHDKLSPSMSALILSSHVKEGVEIARENRLGTTLIDIIQQHHGTGMMRFFYEKARQQHDPELPSIDEREYRYAGPKPQTREAALIMLADAVEAASRTLSDPTPARIQGMVQKIINNIFTDGQLNECELTLKDLHLIARSFNQVLAGIYHHRVDYPEPAFKESSKRKNSEHPDREPAKEAPRQPSPAAKDSPDDLKRLGIS